jgi:hypothetical protein
MIAYRNIILILLCIFLLGCNNNAKFDKIKWLQCDDIEYTPRGSMLKDLTTNYKLKGLSYKQLVNLLGSEAKNYKGEDSSEISYPVLVEYGTIDPIHNITLVIKLSKDSIVTDFHVDEWKRPWR